MKPLKVKVEKLHRIKYVITELMKEKAEEQGELNCIDQTLYIAENACEDAFLKINFDIIEAEENKFEIKIKELPTIVSKFRNIDKKDKEVIKNVKKNKEYISYKKYIDLSEEYYTKLEKGDINITSDFYF